jgi:hypothetical protein
MVMEHMFGQVIVFCLDVPVGVTLMVSGKPENEAALREALTSTLASIEPPVRHSPIPMLIGLLATALFLYLVARFLVRASASRSSR